jgi:hypothetical protein
MLQCSKNGKGEFATECRKFAAPFAYVVTSRSFRLRLHQPDLDLLDLDRATVLAAVLDRGQPGMHIGGGTLGRFHTLVRIGALVPQHRKHVVERR